MKDEVSRSSQLRRIKQEILRKVSFLEHKTVIDYKEVYHLIRQFFKEYLEQDYEFTISELREEIKKTYIPASTREHINFLLETIEHMEYKTTSFTNKELQNILQEFKKTVNELVKVQSIHQNIWEKILNFVIKKEEEPIIISELPVIEKDDYQHVHMNMLLERLHIFLGKQNMHKAKKQYVEVNEYYNTLSKDVKKEFYPLLEEAYDKLLTLAQKK